MSTPDYKSKGIHFSFSVWFGLTCQKKTAPVPARLRPQLTCGLNENPFQEPDGRLNQRGLACAHVYSWYGLAKN